VLIHFLFVFSLQRERASATAKTNALRDEWEQQRRASEDKVRAEMREQRRTEEENARRAHRAAVEEEHKKVTKAEDALRQAQWEFDALTKNAAMDLAAAVASERKKSAEAIDAERMKAATSESLHDVFKVKAATELEASVAAERKKGEEEARALKEVAQQARAQLAEAVAAATANARKEVDALKEAAQRALQAVETERLQAHAQQLEAVAAAIANARKEVDALQKEVRASKEEAQRAIQAVETERLRARTQQLEAVAAATATLQKELNQVRTEADVRCREAVAAATEEAEEAANAALDAMTVERDRLAEENQRAHVYRYRRLHGADAGVGAADKGRAGEEVAADMIARAFPGSILENRGATAASGDLWWKPPGRSTYVLVEVKNYATALPLKEVEKFARDVEANREAICGAMLVCFRCPSIPTLPKSHGYSDIAGVPVAYVCADDVNSTEDNFEMILPAFVHTLGYVDDIRDANRAALNDQGEQRQKLCKRFDDLVAREEATVKAATDAEDKARILKNNASDNHTRNQKLLVQAQTNLEMLRAAQAWYKEGMP